jgi:hypothetical protein
MLYPLSYERMGDPGQCTAPSQGSADSGSSRATNYIKDRCIADDVTFRIWRRLI